MNSSHPIPWSRFSEYIGDALGLHFPNERLMDLQRGMRGAADEFGYEDIGACVEWLLSSPPSRRKVQVLASHLTVGETYFFRDRNTLEAMIDGPIRDMVRSRRGRGQRLRIWSCACCTGEEPYSLAILLNELIPDLRAWKPTILATDINVGFLKRAAAATYGEWSFRGAPARLKARYFSGDSDGRYVLDPQIQKMVTFAYLNLVEDIYPSLASGTNAMDFVFCRNALMYFTEDQKRSVIEKLHRTLTPDGWLAVSPSEVSQWMFPQFVTETLGGGTLYRKREPVAEGPDSLWAKEAFPAGSIPAPLDSQINIPAASVDFSAVEMQSDGAPVPEAESAEGRGTLEKAARLLYEAGKYPEASHALLAQGVEASPGHEFFSLLARALANQGKLEEARNWCERWIAADRLDAAGHYLRAVILLEQGEPEEARKSLQRALYLAPEFVLAHFALGNLARGIGRPGEAEKHFDNALRLLRRHEPGDLVPESDGLTAGRLTETIVAMSAMEHA